MAKSDENIVKKTCKELGITQKELADLIKVHHGTPAQWINKGEIPPSYQLLLELILENRGLKTKLEKLKSFKELLNEL